MRFFSGAWLPSTSMASPAPAEASRCRLRPTLLTERLRALAIALLASRPTLSREACMHHHVRRGLDGSSGFASAAFTLKLLLVLLALRALLILRPP